MGRYQFQFFCSLFAWVIFSSSLFAAPPQPFVGDRLSVDLDNQYFWTDANFDQDGTIVNLVKKNSFSTLHSNLSLTYNHSNHLRYSGGVGFGFSESTGTDTKRSNSRLTDFFVNVQYLFNWPQFRIIPEINAILPFSNIDTNTDIVLTDEGVTQLTAGGWAIYSISKMKIFGYLGYQDRTSSRASLMHWNSGLSFRKNRWTFTGEFNGFQPVVSDPDKDNRGYRVLVNNTVNGGSLYYYSVNPSLSQVLGRIDFAQAREFSYYAGIAYPLLGNSYAQGTTLLFGMTIIIDSGSENDSLGTKSRRRRSTDDQFKASVENDYEEDLFRPESDDTVNP